MNTIAEDATVAATGNMITDDDSFGVDSDTDANAVLTVSGVTGGEAHGALTWNADGIYSYAVDNTDAAVQALGVGQTLTENYTYTLADGAGGSDTATLTITITGTNDAPTVNGGSGTVYESGLLEGSQVVPNTTTSTGQLIFSDVDGDSLDIVIDDTTYGTLVENGSKTLAIATVVTGKGTLIVYEAGNWEYELTDNVSHDTDDSTFLDPENDTFKIQVSDGTTLSSIQNLVVNIVDDVPVNIRPDFAYLNNEGTPSVPVFVTEALDFDDNIDNNIGADQTGSVKFADSLDGSDSGLTSGGLAITYAIAGNTLTTTAGGSIVFTVTLNHDATDITDDMYTVTMVGTVDGGLSEIQFNDGSYNFVGGNGSWAGFNTLANDDSPDLLLTPMENGVSAGTLNTNANSGGVSQGSSVGSGEAMRVDFVTDLDETPVSAGDYSNPIYQNHTFDGHYETNGASASFAKIGTDGATIRIKAFDDPDGNQSVGDGAEDSITAIAIEYNGQTTLVSSGHIGTLATTYNVGGNSFTVQFMDVDPDPVVMYEAVIQNVIDDTSIATYTAVNYNSIEYHYESGYDADSTFKIGDFATTTVDPGAPVDIILPVEIEDADGDIAHGTIDVLLLPENSPIPQDFTDEPGPDGVVATSTPGAPHIIGSDYDDTLDGDGNSNILYGQDGDDTLDGGAGDDYIDGGDGVDEIDGGAGDDTIVFDAADSTIDGGSDADGLDIDTLKVAGTDTPPTHLDFSKVYNIEKIDMDNGIADQEITLTMDDVLNMTGPDGGTLKITGDANEKVTINDDADEWGDIPPSTDSAGIITFTNDLDPTLQVHIDPDDNVDIVI